MNDQLPPILQNPQADGKSFFWKGSSSAGVLLLHGFTATTVEVRNLAMELHKEGYTVAGKLLPGHGVSPEELNKVSWEDWLACAEDGLAELRHHCESVFVAGESMGGLLSILLASYHPELAGILLFAPALIIPGLWKSKFVWPFKKYIYKKNVDLSSPWQGFNVVPLHAASELCQLQVSARRSLNKVVNPVILFQGKKDQTIDPISSVIVLEKVYSSDKQLVWLDKSTHCIMLDPQLKEAYPLALEFLQTHSS